MRKTATIATAIALAVPVDAEGQTRARVHVITMEAMRFHPALTEARAGDTLRFVNGPGGPHNVAFVVDSVPAAVRPLFAKALPDQIAPLAGPFLADPGEVYVVVVPAAAPGRYPYLCVPHYAQMKGTLVVRP